jgi:uncharacterized membrane protein YgdD (TMEM256/DUF423 family)
MDRQFFAIGSLLALLAVAAGAFGGHALKDTLGPDRIDIFKTGAQYQMYHSLALLAVAFAVTRWQDGLLNVAGWLFVGGIVLFSGSLYALAITDVKVLGAITPLGGLCFLIAWALLAVVAWRA